MKTILIIFSLFILSSQFSILNSTLWEIKQDGTGDFTTITEGIDAAVDGDTLLVHRGIYYENIHYGHKNIVITSLYGIESNDRSIIRETVIDGGHDGTVVMFHSRQITRDAVLSGFTIRNGAAWRSISGGPSYPGGGIYLGRATPIIQYCIVEHNFSYVGAGGIQSYVSGPLLIGNTIRYNHGLFVGGLNISGGFNDNLPHNAELCSEKLNSVYQNHGGSVYDISILHIRQESVIIDTLTVQEIDPYFVRIRNDYQMPHNFSLTINHGKIEPVPSDLYVSPDGCDNNSGLTSEEPLQRIATAMKKIEPDEEQQRTVHLAEGVYSHSLNNQLFPLGMRTNVDIVGIDKETTILDGEDKYLLKMALIHSATDGVLANFTIKNLTITRGHRGSQRYGALFCWFARDFRLENIDFTNSGYPEDHRWGGHRFIIFEGCDDFTLRNIGIYNNSITDSNFGEALFSVHRMESGQTMYAENVRFRDNYSPNGPSRMFVMGIIREPNPYHATFVNLEMTDNTCYTIGHWGYGAFFHIDAKVRLINATIAGKRYYNVDNPAAISIGNYHNARNELSVYNSIFYDNGGDYQMLFTRHPSHGGGPDVINVSHSLIENGRDGITEIYDVGSIVNWGEGNIDEDPLFVGKYNEFGDKNRYPYMLSEDSPARGAGTLDIPDFEFPEYDIAGNPRIVDGKIDMGAYQYHKPTTSIEDEEREGVTERLKDGEFNLHNFPNPVTYLHSERQAGQTRSSTGTTISFEAPESGEVVIEIYNVKGQFVRRVFDAYITKGEYNVFWDGKDERGRYVATGFYMYNLHFNDELVATGRATFIK